MAAPTIRAVTETAEITNTANPAVTSPTSTEVGDLLIFFLHTYDSSNAHTIQSGFTEICTLTADDQTRFSAAYKVATTAGATSYQPYQSSGLSDDHMIAMLAITKDTFDSTAPINDEATTFSSSSDPPNPPSITTTVDDCLVLACGIWDTGGQVTSGPPSGYTSQIDEVETNAIAVASKALTTAGVEDPSGFTDDLSPANTGAATIAIAPAVDSPYRDEVLSDSPVAYWRLGEPSGTTASDETANNLDGTYNGSPTLGATGLLDSDANTAVTFDNTDDYVNVPDNALLDFGTGSFSVECWFARTTTSDWGIMAGKRNNTGSTAGWYIGVDNSGNSFHWRLHDGTNPTNCPDIDATSYLDGNPHHVVATRDGSTGDLKLYIDGVKVSELLGASVLNVDNTIAFRIGRLAEASTFFSGTLDEVAVYGTALSEARIQAHYEVGSGTVLSSGFTGWGVPL